ncbi:hypothetical protein [Porphyromonas somerae]|uniref:hypothetical protein n=1 Tax=Porphyromonas somerae TaxID=322095 RepID=UPI001FCB153F|nr:hypothetical protein [Porphyromonas somerae]BDE81772.1 hypothetical protein CE91St14_08000 [Porphyromonas somerae]
MKQSIRILALYEAMGGTSILSGKELTHSDITHLLHAYVCVKGEKAVSVSVLNEIMSDTKKGGELMDEIDGFLAEQSVWGELITKDASKSDVSTSDMTVTSVIGMLVAECGISPKYVMDEMELWEIAVYVGGLNEKQKKHLEEKRIFTFLGMSPLLGNSSKNLTPQDVIKFPWDDDTNNDAQAFVEQNYNELHKILNGTAYAKK